MMQLKKIFRYLLTIALGLYCCYDWHINLFAWLAIGLIFGGLTHLSIFLVGGSIRKHSDKFKTFFSLLRLYILFSVSGLFMIAFLVLLWILIIYHKIADKRKAKE
jgi:hypothetical protein